MGATPLENVAARVWRFMTLMAIEFSTMLSDTMRRYGSVARNRMSFQCAADLTVESSEVKVLSVLYERPYEIGVEMEI